ncbi:MAG: hypothetical protein LBD24_06725 [Spirochaetaceae bacterium]|nr:hypothetical protein [Spirochaetaceae bacterium]
MKRGKAGGECVRARYADRRCLRRDAGSRLKPSETARSVAAPKQQPARSPDTVLHHSETTGGHTEAVGDGG